jgi:GNAT superfamily N-acetyltransferase
MEIRDIATTDLDDLLSLYTHLHSSDVPLPSRETIETTWKKIQGNQDLKYFGGYVDKTLVTSCTLTLIPNLTRGCRPYGVIENVVTHKNFRRKGYGKAVLQFALEHAWSKNCYKVMLLTGRKDDDTFRFYESVGFDRNSKQAFLAKPKKVEQAASANGRDGHH